MKLRSVSPKYNGKGYSDQNAGLNHDRTLFKKNEKSLNEIEEETGSS